MATISAGHAQPIKVYRVELLVLRHLESTAEARSVGELRDLSNLLDPSPDDDGGDGAPAIPQNPLYLGPPDTALLPPLGPFPDDPGPWPNLTFLEQRSERMNAVWRNLRLSGEFRPEVFLAWEQSAEEPFPELRVHGEEIFHVEDPYAALRNTGSSYLFQYDLESAVLRLAPLPEPVYHYVVDGSARLRRSRFLHFDLDLVFLAGSPLALFGHAGPPLRADLAAYAVHELRQSRQVRTDRMEYFDSPVLGALLWVTEIEIEEESEE